jgi:hypothetical protein
VSQIAELNMLLRARAELPAGLQLSTREFREGWSFVRTSNAKRLGKKITKRGWSFIKIADCSLRSGVAKTAQEAIASALKLTLRRVDEHFNAVEVEHIELIRYPWFYLASVRVYPYRIQQSAELSIPSEIVTPQEAGQEQSPSSDAAEPFPSFVSAMPLLKQSLISMAGPAASA